MHRVHVRRNVSASWGMKTDNDKSTMYIDKNIKKLSYKVEQNEMTFINL